MFVKVKDGIVEKYPITLNEFRKMYSNIIFPKNLSNELLAEYGVHQVVIAPSPDFDEKTQRLVSQQPVCIDGVWTVTKNVVEKTKLEIDTYIEQQKFKLRDLRNALLERSDWTQVADAPVDQEAWATYRQALRDLPEAEGWPDVSLPNDPFYVAPLSGNAD